MSTLIHHATVEETDKSVDDLFAELSEEFGIKKPSSSLSKKRSDPIYFPSSPQWTTVAVTLLAVEQHCDCCGEDHHYSQGVFLEQIASNTTARRFTPYFPSSQSSNIEELPRRKDIKVEHVSECYQCFNFEERLLCICEEPSSQMQFSFEGESI